MIYRSRSAMQLLFEAVDRPEINPEQDDWFEFERMTAILLKDHLGFTLLSRAPRGGDRHRYSRDQRRRGSRHQFWIVQCKCYGPINPVGPDKIRELIGSIIDFRREKDQIVRGMVVTSSRFTPEATRLPVIHSITVIDQSSLIDIYTAVNRFAHRTLTSEAAHKERSASPHTKR